MPTLVFSVIMITGLLIEDGHLMEAQFGSDGFKYSFFNRVVDEWNGLPNHIRESNSIATFKRNVLRFIKDN